MLHERKFQTVHEHFFFEVCCKLSPTLSKTTHSIVTDEERGYVNAIAKYMESCRHLRCWNHIIQDARRWLRDPKRKAPALDTASYLQDTRALFHLPTEDEYNEELVKMLRKWSAAFLENYNTELAPDITSIARWAIDPLGVHNPFSGITNNQAEGLNFVLQHLRDWREGPNDCMALAMNYLKGYYKLELDRGKQGLGNYHLHYVFYNITDGEILIPSDHVYQTEEIVKRLRENLANDSLQSQLQQTNATDLDNVQLSKKRKLEKAQLTQLERAKQVVETVILV